MEAHGAESEAHEAELEAHEAHEAGHELEAQILKSSLCSGSKNLIVGLVSISQLN